MITYTDFQSRLAHGQLKSTAAVDSGIPGTIAADSADMVLSLTNQGLDDLATRFPLQKNIVDLTFIDSQNVYPLTQTNLSTFLSVPTGESAFLDGQFIKVLDVFDELGERYTTNSNGHIMQPSYNSLRFSTDMMTDITAIGENSGKVRIRYQAKFTSITANDSIILPPNLITALQLFVASLFISHMGGKDHSAKGDSYFGAYLRHIGEDVAKDLSSTSEVDTNTKFEDRGFV